MSEHRERLDEKRRQFETALRDAQESVRRTVGMRVDKRAWLLPLLAAGVGLTLALTLRRRRLRAGSTGTGTSGADDSISD